MVQQLNTKSSNIFNMFPNYNLGTNASVQNTTNNTTLVKDEVELKAGQKKKVKRRILFGSTIASTILTAGIVGLCLGKGIHGSAFKNRLTSYTQKLGQDIHELSELSVKDIPTRILYYSKKGLKKVLDTLQASSNITTFKDYGSNVVLKKTKPTRIFAQKTTKAFNKIVDRTLGKQYDLVGMDISDLTSLVDQHNIEKLRKLNQSQIIEIKGVTKTLGEWLDDLAIQSERLSGTFKDNFSLGARMKRDERRMELLSDLPEKIKERFFSNGKKSLFNPANYKTYATEDIAKPVQKQFEREIIGAKKQISNNIQSIAEQLKTRLNSLIETIKIDDKAIKPYMDDLSSLFKKFKECSGVDEVIQREQITSQISDVVEKIIGELSTSSKYTDDEKKVILNILDEIKSEISQKGATGSKGALEEIMTIIKGLNGAKIADQSETFISNDTYKRIKKLSERISTDLKKATDLETGEYFMKKSELIVGSAPTDVISVFVPIGAGAYAIAKGDSKEEKVSATLTTCVPLVGTFATFVYGTVKMLAGAKNLIFSAVSGALLGMFGDYCDGLYKKSKNPDDVKHAVADSYDKIWTGIESQIHKFDENEENKVKK